MSSACGHGFAQKGDIKGPARACLAMLMRLPPDCTSVFDTKPVNVAICLGRMPCICLAASSIWPSLMGMMAMRHTGIKFVDFTQLPLRCLNLLSFLGKPKASSCSFERAAASTFGTGAIEGFGAALRAHTDRGERHVRNVTARTHSFRAFAGVSHFSGAASRRPMRSAQPLATLCRGAFLAGHYALVGGLEKIVFKAIREKGS